MLDARGRETDELHVLRRQLAEAQQTISALIAREIDAVVAGDAGAPLLLQQAQAELRRSEKSLRAVFEGALDGMLIADDDGRLHDANAAAVELLGLPREALLNHSLGDFAECSALFGALWSSLFAHGVHEGAFVLLRPDRQRRLVDLRARRDILPGRHLAVLRDVTERRRLEESLRRAEKMQAIGQLAGGVAHDFNNLLTVITTSSELLLEQLADSPQLQALADEARVAAFRGAALTRQLLTFSRRQATQPKVVSLAAVVLDLRPMLARLLPEHIRLTMPAEAPPSYVKADRGQLEQLVVNLAINARDAMPEGGHLHIGLADETLDVRAANALGVAPGRYVELTVTDTGHGIAPEIRERLFEPFFTTKAPGHGTGLGLPTVYGIVSRGGGAIEVDSAPGAGTTFRVRLPASADAGAQPSQPPAAARQAGDGATVLFVEDERIVRSSVERGLRAAGYRVLACASPEEALEQLEHEGARVDLLLTDVVMPGMNGRQLASRARLTRPDLRVLYISGYPDSVLDHQGVLAPGVALLEKPFDRATLVARIREVLEAPEAPGG